jgi:hypothetical protein
MAYNLQWQGVAIITLIIASVLHLPAIAFDKFNDVHLGDFQRHTRRRNVLNQSELTLKRKQAHIPVPSKLDGNIVRKLSDHFRSLETVGHLNSLPTATFFPMAENLRGSFSGKTRRMAALQAYLHCCNNCTNLKSCIHDPIVLAKDVALFHSASQDYLWHGLFSQLMTTRRRNHDQVSIARDTFLLVGGRWTPTVEKWNLTSGIREVLFDDAPDALGLHHLQVRAWCGSLRRGACRWFYMIGCGS